MRGIYIPHHQRDWEVFFNGRAGQRGQGIEGFNGFRYQRGAGIGSVFSGLFRTLLPVAKSVGRVVGKQALSTGVQVAADALAGNNLGQSLEQRGKEAAAILLNKGVRRLKRGGPKKRKRRQTGHGRRIRRRRRRPKRLQRGRGLGVRPKRGSTKATPSIKGRKRGRKASASKRRHSDQLGTYFA